MEILSGAPIDAIIDGFAIRSAPGRADKVLWLHGYTLDSSSWGEMWPLLPGWHHVGIDLPGHGQSDPIPAGGNLRDLGRRLGKLCAEQGIRHIVGLSFGTISAIQTAMEFPDLFSSIVLGAPALAGGPQDPEMAAVYSKLIAHYRGAGADEELVRTWMESRAWRGIEKRPELGEALLSLVRKHPWNELASYTRMLQFTHPPQKEAELARIRTPMTILVGEFEMPAFLECARILQRCVADCSLHVLPETGHLCMLETPELSARLIDAHLREHAVPAPP
jgi:pimeloyl-ACP methyl ester carboxylesterase